MKIIVKSTLASMIALIGAANPLQAQFGQQQQPQQTPQQQQQTPQQAQQPPQLQQAPAPVATVNGDPITQSEYTSALEPQLKQVDPNNPQAAQQIRQQVLNSLIESRLVEQYMVSKGPDIPGQEVDAVINQYKQQLESQGVSFDQFMQSRGLSKPVLEKRIQGGLAWQKYQKSELTDENLQAYFDANQSSFQTDKFEEAKPQVSQLYVNQLWEGIVKEAQPQAEIKITQPAR